MSIGRKTGIRSFTLVELLIVIAILAVLAAAVVVVLNPAELLAQARDSQRVTDMRTMKDAIDLWTVDNPSVTMGTAQTVYISLPDTSSTCATYTTLPTLPAGWVYHCVTTSNSRNIDGTGWIPLNFTTVKGGSPVPYLPLDPQNDSSLTKYYSYIPGGSYELTALFESEKQGKTAWNDGGTDPGRLEVGSDLNLWTVASGLKGYWNFDESSGAAANSTIGSIAGVVSGATWTSGKRGTALNFDGNDDKIEVAPAIALNGPLSISFWGYSNGYSNAPGIGGDQANYGVGGRICFRSATTFGFWTPAATVDPINFTSAFPTGQWFHMVVTRDTSNVIRIYRNGENVTSGSYSGSGLLNIARIGDNPDNSGLLAWSGLMDEYYVYDRQLKDGEIREIYNSGK